MSAKSDKAEIVQRINAAVRLSKKLESLVKAARLYAGSTATSISTQQKLYNRFMKLSSSVAKDKEMSLSDVVNQTIHMARMLGPIVPTPGKDY
jgi:hypothetical protein